MRAPADVSTLGVLGCETQLGDRHRHVDPLMRNTRGHEFASPTLVMLLASNTRAAQRQALFDCEQAVHAYVFGLYVRKAGRLEVALGFVAAHDLQSRLLAEFALLVISLAV